MRAGDADATAAADAPRLRYPARQIAVSTLIKKTLPSMTRMTSPATLLRLLLTLALGLEPGLIPLARATAPIQSDALAAPRAARMQSPPAPVDASTQRDAPADPAPEGSPPLPQAAPGVTAVAGRVLETQGAPLAGVTLRLGQMRATTDKDGLFLLEGVAPGEAVLIIDGRHALARGEASAADHGLYEARVTALANRTTQLPWVSWLPRIDHDHDVGVSTPTAADIVATTPAVPGLELRIPKGAVLTGLDGEAVTKVGLTPIPINRPPFPLPRNVEVPVYFTAQPGGAVISGAKGEWLGAQVVYPNYRHELPKARGVFWRYEPDGLGWSPYGMGSVQADGRQFVPDPDTRIYALSGAMFATTGAPADGPNASNNPTPASSASSASPLPDGSNSAKSPNPDAAAPKNPSPNAGDPVDLGTGLYVQRQTDLEVGGILPLAVTRTYRPGDYNSRAFGVGMTLTYSSTLVSTQLWQVVDLIMPDGGKVHYTRIINPANPTDNGYVTAHFTTVTSGLFYQSHIDWNGNGWNLTRTDGVVLVFGDVAPMQSMRDRFGNTITLTRTSGTFGDITQVSATGGRFIRFTYDISDRIIQAVDNAGRAVNYTYDASGRLTTVKDANGGVTTYAWDSSNRVQSITDARGVTYITNTYDANDRLTKQVLADGTSYQFAYTLDANGKVTQTDVTDPRGYLRKVTFNAAGYALTDHSAAGTPQEADWSYTLDPVSNLPTSMTDPLGRSTSRAYDANGNVLGITLAAGTASAATTSYAYSALFNQVTSVTDPLGHQTIFNRNALDLMTSSVDPLGKSTAYTYSAQGQLLTATDPLGNVAHLNCGVDGDLVSATDPLGRTASYYTDAIGRPLTATDPLGATTVLTHDPINGPRQITDANGLTTTTAYTPIGKVASVTDARGGQVAFTYAPSGRMATRSDALGAVTRVTQRDGLGNVLAATDRKGQAASFTYDPLNRPLTASYADGTLSFTFDAAGRLTKLVDSVGGTVTRSYDSLDRLMSETTPQGTVAYTYDAAGRRLTMQAGNQAQVAYAYDNADRLTGITQGTTSVGYTYDTAGRRVSASLPGGITASYGYDAASQLTAITYASGATTLGTLTYGYDLAGRVNARGGSLFQSLLPAAVTSVSYDLANRLTSRTASGVTVTPSWDANGNLANDGQHALSFDARNRLTAIAGVASFAYDGFGRRVTATRAGVATSFLYDGWDVAQEQQGGAASANLLAGSGIDEHLSRNGSTYLADALGSTVALASGGAVKTSYGYDPYGAAQVTGTASDNTFQYTGRENDGTRLYYYRARYYAPLWGRFISEDPIGFAGGDVNLYRYVGNDPIDFSDPSGLILEPGVGGNSAPDASPSAAPTGANGGPPDQVAAGSKPIVRCPGLGGITCGAPTPPGGINPDYPNVCTTCLIRNKLWPYPGAKNPYDK
jgi:RHS repeat-associated protein